jgi:hypothetical protein
MNRPDTTEIRIGEVIGVERREFPASIRRFLRDIPVG